MKYFLLIAIIFTFLRKRNPLTFINNIEFQWPLIILVCFGVQIALAFITIETNKKLDFILIITFVGIVMGLWRNRGISGVKWVLTGSFLNLTALLLHGGLMPVSESALSMTGQEVSTLASDSRHQLMENSMQFWILGDWIPVVRYVLSPGDFFVGIGIILLVYCNSSKIHSKGEGI